MRRTRRFQWALMLGIGVGGVSFGTAPAQVRGVYPVGMNATNSGAISPSGFTYSNLFIFYSRDELKDAGGETTATGRQSVLMDMNSFIWASTRTILGGARFSAAATLPIANNSLTSDAAGAISGGGGFADSYYQPCILGWQMQRADIRVAYGFLAPTGRFDGNADDNVGSGYWTHVVSSGQTLYLSESKSTALSAFQMYEFHGTQEDTGIEPGQTLNLDYSLTHTLPVREDILLQVGVAGYGQWQMSDKSGPDVTAEQANARYRINSLGFATNVILSERQTSLGLKFFQEFGGRSTVEGSSLQISGTTNF